MAIKTWPNWAHSHQNRPISLHAGNLSLKQAPFLWIGGVHGDEPEGVALAKATLDWLRTTEEIAIPWYLIPCLNPDGLALGQRVNARGVDLNRNYPSRGWSSHYDKPRYHPGDQPASEPEIESLVQLIAHIQPQLIVHFHSWQPCIVCTGAPGLKYARLLAEGSGYPLQESIGYDTPGSLSEFGWHDNRIPVICIEAQEKSDLKTVWPRFAPGIKKIFTKPPS